ncbi:tRNA (cytidine(34)-2'-O)-methyltransferase [Aestuariivirga sp.]|uniref:tRNA (cytidine(34)-2'-O)-methyltransferase n=1 Tax=Aestuariivirga sp. TaxID=2650926 RepID=UPI003BAB5624
MVEIALYQPDIAPNAATILRMCACFGLTCRIIEPAGFVSGDSQFRRAGMDYLKKASLVRDASWTAFREATAGRRSVLITTRATQPYWDFAFQAGDVILMGRESSGVPDGVHEKVEARLTIPMHPGMRSLNVALACAMVTGEALRQLRG